MPTAEIAFRGTDAKIHLNIDQEEAEYWAKFGPPSFVDKSNVYAIQTTDEKIIFLNWGNINFINIEGE